MELNLLPKHLLINTGPVDHADWNYRPVLRWIQRSRFRMVLSLIGNNYYDQILEIGYGSGIFMPTLSKYCNKLSGIDIHPFKCKVDEILKYCGISASLYQGSASEMPFADESFDLIVSISSFEFIDDKINACKEIRRVLKKNGSFIIITPGKSKILDIGLKILTGEDPKKDYGETRQAFMPILYDYFYISTNRTFPMLIGYFVPVYCSFILLRKD